MGGADTGTYYHSDAEANVQDFFNLHIERGHPDYDVSHRLVADWIYESPALANRSAPLRTLLGGWQIAGFFTSQTGLPLRITQSCSNNWLCRADYVGGDIKLPNWQKREIGTGCLVGVHCDVQYLNLSAFALAPAVSGVAIRRGNAGTSLVRAPGFWQVGLVAVEELPPAGEDSDAVPHGHVQCAEQSQSGRAQHEPVHAEHVRAHQ